MKKLLLLFISLSLLLQTQAQSTIKDKAYFFQKSKKQKTAAFALLIGGAVAGTVGLLVGTGDETSFDNAGTGVIVGGIGLISMAGSIPLFIAAKRNKTKAETMAGIYFFQRVPGPLAIRIPLNASIRFGL
ncbi:MAG TPA: hypothetical protein VHN59_01715 [Chitinophagaceae bacterium]|nr:hypothetical protein [Chitinophagaceae bacterium]